MAKTTIAADPMAPSRPAGRFGTVARSVVATVLGGLLCWQIGSAGLAALAARSTDPRLLAVSGTPAHPEAGSLLAQALLVSNDNDAAAGLARSVVLVDPTNDRALRVLGLATEKLGEKEEAAAILRQGAALGWRDTPTQLWVLHDAAERDDPVTVIQRADALARRNRAGELTRAVFLAALNEPRLRAELINSLARQPMWRGAFFADIRQNLPASAAPGVEVLFAEMHARGQATTPVEKLSYVERLIDLGEFRHARDIWATAFKIPVGRLRGMPYDGRFQLAAGRANDAPTSRFEWTFDPNLVGALTFTGGAQGSMLTVPSDISGGTTIMSQIVMLAPGPHILTSKVDGSAAAAGAGWSISCLPGGADLPRRLGHGPDDELSMVSFTVLNEGCQAQEISLVARDRPDGQAVSIGDVRIR